MNMEQFRVLLLPLAQRLKSVKVLDVETLLKFSVSPIATFIFCKYINKQMIWADTRYVGCGYSNCDQVPGFPLVMNLVCYYYPAGNIELEYPYEAGIPCTNCDGDRTTLCDDAYAYALCAGGVDSSFNIDGTIDVDTCDNGLGQELPNCSVPETASSTTSDPTAPTTTTTTSEPTTSSPITSAPTTSAPTTRQGIARVLGTNEKQFILDWHNDIRNTVADGNNDANVGNGATAEARNMNELLWV